MPSAMATLAHGDRALRRPALRYFALAFAVSWVGALLVAAPHLLRGQAIPKFAGLMMFPAMLLGPALAGIAMIARTEGAAGLRVLFRRMIKVRVPLRWYAVLFIAPVAVFTTLSIFSVVASPAFAPNFFVIGISFGLVAGFFEEIGWTGFAFPALHRGRSAFASSLLLGLLWGLWHVPVIDYLGASSPHGAFWLPYFAAFTLAMTAMRVLICWVYANTRSVLLAQLLHASSTGALVIFSPHVSASQETFWYLGYAAILWIIVAIVRTAAGKELRRL